MIGASLAGLAASRVATVGALASIAIGVTQAALPSLDDLLDGPGASMEMKLERTFLKIDVLHISVRVAPSTAGELARILGSESRYDRRLEESVAEAVRTTPEAIAEIEFLRDIRLGQFLDGVVKDMSRAERAGWIDHASYEGIRDGLPGWFAALSTRGLEKGDRLLYHVRGDTLRTTYVTQSGEVLVDQTDVGRANVLALLGGYYAPGTSFRRGLVRSLWEGR